MRVRVYIMDTLTLESTEEIHEIPELTLEAVRNLIIADHQEIICEEYDGSSLTTLGGGVEGHITWATFKEQGSINQGDWLIFVHAHKLD